MARTRLFQDHIRNHQIQRIYLSDSASGLSVMVTGVAGHKIIVLSYMLNAAGSVNATFKTSSGATDLTGLHYMSAGSGAVCPFNPIGWFASATGEGIELHLSAAVAIGGHMQYIVVEAD